MKKLDKNRLDLNVWNDARILTHITNLHFDRTSRDLGNSQLHVMTTQPYRRNPVRNGDDVYYNDNADNKVSLDYLRAGKMPYSINTVHLQNPYRSSQMEGFTVRDSFKDTYRSNDFILRSRHNNLFAKKKFVGNKNIDQENEKIEKSKRKKSEVSIECADLTKQYLANSSLHGLRYIGNSMLSPIERIFWLISFVIALIISVYYICYLYKKWMDAPIVNILSPEPVALNDFPFPSVTICNMNHVKKSEAMRIEQGSNMMSKFLMDDVCNFSESNVTYDEKKIKWDQIQQFMLNVSQSCTDMFYYCSWHGNETDCTKIFNTIMTDEGICCNFNSVDRKFLLYHPREWSDLNITYPAVSIDWNPEKGYNKSIPSNVLPERPHGTGQQYGLTLVLDAEIDEYYCSSTVSAGFKMLLHNPVEMPKIADFSFAISPGKETRVIVRPQITVAKSTIIGIPRRKRKCFFTNEKKLRFYRTYTQRNCILECQANHTQNMCNCVQYYMPKSANTPICGKKEEPCALKAKQAMELTMYDEQENTSSNVQCNCWPGCFEIDYRAELSQSKLISSFPIDKRYLKKNKEYFVKNIAVVHLFFVDSQFTKYMKTELFGFIEFLSSTGGLLGLFLGFSFLSVVEILYFLTLRTWCRIHRRSKAIESTMLPTQPLHYNNKMIYPFAN